ncbi:spore germination protein GerW family protein [Streptomyces albicerus]|uniref:spore germination protein GerW family protein n=1 Tax=Streptomyces albicerus TaxID=2569859 RepID=UPI00124B39CE|nr:spore germination protein GerW family protein [Streptomyces albicerus]
MPDEEPVQEQSVQSAETADQPTTEPAQTVERPTETAEASPALPPEDAGTVNPAVALLERLAEKLGGRASVTTVYGAPVTGDGVTVIPVARVGFGFGAGVGREVDAAKTGEGGGGGGGAGAKPVGFIEIRNGSATYRPIRDPWVDVVVPLAALVLGGALPKIVRALRRRD